MFEKQKPIQKDNLHNQVYERLCKMLRQGEFNPGESVAVARIAKAFDVSPMPVREALLRLQAMGVLSNVSGRSVGVPQVTEENRRIINHWSFSIFITIAKRCCSV